MPAGIHQNKLALSIGVSAGRINETNLGKRSISADAGLRLAKFSGNLALVWLGFQIDYDVDIARELVSEKLNSQVQSFDFDVVLRPRISDGSLKRRSLFWTTYR